MIKTKTESSLISTNSTAMKRIQMRVEDTALIMGYMANLYPNPIQTLTQEYLCNGRDAQREAGNANKPLLVTLPTEKFPTLKIRDFGNGLSEEKVSEVFVVFGKSTKTKTNAQTGGFGVGGKSAWSYTDNFTIVSYVNGTASHYVAMRDGGNGVGELRLQAQNQTKEPNGIEIQIAVKKDDVEKFGAAVERATMHWEVKPEFDGEGIDYRSPVKVVENIHFCEESCNLQSNGIYLAVDGIPYLIDSKKYEGTKEFDAFKSRIKPARYRQSYGSSQKGGFNHVVIHCGNGDVEIALNRESLQDSETTTSGIVSILKQAQKTLTKAALEELKNSEDLREFLRRHSTIRASYKLECNATFTHDSGDEYVVSPEGKIVDGLPKNLSALILEKSGRRGKTEVKSVSPTEVPPLRAFYTDCKISNTQATLRLKTKLQKGEDAGDYDREEYAYMFSAVVETKIGDKTEYTIDSECVEFFQRIGAQDIYGIHVQKAIAKPTDAKESEVQVSTFDNTDRNSSWRNRNDRISSLRVDTDTEKETYVYIVKDMSNTSSHSKFYEFNEVCKAVGVKLCFVAPTREKKLEGHSVFVPLKKFFKDLPKYVSPAHLTLMKAAAKRVATQPVRNQVDYLLESAQFMKASGEIKDKETVKLFRELAKVGAQVASDNYVDSQSGILEALAALDTEVNEIKSEADRILARIVKNYPMLHHTRLDTGDVDNCVSEIVWYMNAKFKEGLKD